MIFIVGDESDSRPYPDGNALSLHLCILMEGPRYEDRTHSVSSLVSASTFRGDSAVRSLSSKPSRPCKVMVATHRSVGRTLASGSRGAGFENTSCACWLHETVEISRFYEYGKDARISTRPPSWSVKLKGQRRFPCAWGRVRVYQNAAALMARIATSIDPSLTADSPLSAFFTRKGKLLSGGSKAIWGDGLGRVCWIDAARDRVSANGPISSADWRSMVRRLLRQR